jgi:uncharacterized membrane protein YGL010W
VTTLLFLLQIYLAIGLSTWGIIVLILYSNSLVVQVTPKSIIGWALIVVGWPFVVGWFVNQMLDAFSEVIDQTHGGGGPEGDDGDYYDDD